MKTIRIGTRESKLAIWQAEWVKDSLTSIYPGIDCVLVPKKTKGDKIPDIPLPKIGDKGFFTEELEQALLTGEIDLAVHSLKDLPVELPQGLSIAAYGERHDPRDVFFGKEGLPLAELPAGSMIGTSSLRRQCQLKYQRADLNFCDLRGNLDTRWDKLQNSRDMAGIVLAAAGALRLGWQDRITEFLAEDVVLPAVGQGIIAIETASHRTEIRQILQPLNHRPSELAGRAERSFLRSLGGGCQTPIAALAKVQEDRIQVTGMVAGMDGKNILKVTAEGFDPEQTGADAAAQIKCLGANNLLKEIQG